MRLKHICRAALLIGLGLGGARVGAAGVAANSPYYEEDGLLDITEWFDGNDYNPTDEAWWRWDDETYQAAKDTSGDRDSDNWYGYTGGSGDRDIDNWYYDYYDPYTFGYYDLDDDGVYDYASHYYDFDNDGLYDAYATSADWNNDGIFDDFTYYSFTDKGTDRQRQNAQAQSGRESRRQQVTGRIQKTKLVQVRGGQKHLVVALRPQGQQGQQNQQGQQSGQAQQQQQGQFLAADLGNIDDLKSVNPKVGDTITVTGPKAQVGKQPVILAKSFDLNGKTTQVDRSPRNITGKVLSTHKTKVRGGEHLMAMVQADQKGKSHKVAVDLGRADRLQNPVNKGDSLTFSGFPVKVRNKPLIVAQSIQQGDKMVQINRQPNQPGDQAQPAAGPIQGQQQQQGGQNAQQQPGNRQQEQRQQKDKGSIDKQQQQKPQQ